MQADGGEPGEPGEPVSVMTPKTAAPELGIDPRGRLHLLASSPEGPGQDLPPRLAKAVLADFEAGTGAGLLALASRHLSAALPASLSFGRKLAMLYFHALATSPASGDEPGRAVAGPAPREGELKALLDALPPLVGAEYASLRTLSDCWREIDAAAKAERSRFRGTLHDYLQSKNPAWHGVGRLTFHLAEQKSSPLTPFAFLATHAEGVGEAGRLRHVPLGKALARHEGDRATLLRLLRPLNAACERSDFIRALAASGDIYHPLSWTAEEAHAFLRCVPDCEAAGLAVRVPDWWSAPAQLRATAQVGGSPASGLGVDALLDFRAALTLGGEELSAEEREELLSGVAGLRLIRGRWVEVDPERLKEALALFERLERGAGDDGLPLGEALRLLAGAGRQLGEAAATDEAARWAGVEAGPWLAELLEDLRAPSGGQGTDPGSALKGSLRHYQRDGVAWLQLLWRLGLGGCLADDMGLGKTIQVIALILLAKKGGETGPHLLVLPTSLLGNWQAELARFAPSLKVLVAHASELGRDELAGLSPARLRRADVVLTTFGTLPRVEALGRCDWGLVVLDEAQAIKNPGTRAAKAAKALRSRGRFALTGTPIENRLGDLWSIFDFLCPGLLGTKTRFATLTKKLATGEADPAPLRRLLRPYVLRRLKTDPSIAPDLPEKTELTVHCGLSKLQATLYEQAVAELSQLVRTAEPMKRRGLVLAYLMRFKQICNHPSLFTGEEDFDPAESGKFARLGELCETLAARQERLLVFTQFRQMTEPLARHLETLFGRPGLVLHGGTGVRARQALVDRFQAEDGPPFFVLSLKAGGTGLNLTAASHVVHFDRWWNPAVENQATDRAFRIGQVRNVLVHAFSCRGTVEEKIDAMLESKRVLAEGILDFSGESALTELAPDELLDLVSLDADRALAG